MFTVLVQAKTEIAKEVKDTLTKSMASFGFMIIETLVSPSLLLLASSALMHLIARHMDLALHAESLVRICRGIAINDIFLCT